MGGFKHLYTLADFELLPTTFITITGMECYYSFSFLYLYLSISLILFFNPYLK